MGWVSKFFNQCLCVILLAFLKALYTCDGKRQRHSILLLLLNKYFLCLCLNSMTSITQKKKKRKDSKNLFVGNVFLSICRDYISICNMSCGGEFCLGMGCTSASHLICKLDFNSSRLCLNNLFSDGLQWQWDLPGWQNRMYQCCPFFCLFVCLFVFSCLCSRAFCQCLQSCVQLHDPPIPFPSSNLKSPPACCPISLSDPKFSTVSCCECVTGLWCCH